MNVKVGFGSIIGIFVILIAGVIFYKVYKLGKPIKEVVVKTFTETLNPVSNKNIAYTTISDIATTKKTDGTEDNFVDKIFRWFGGKEEEDKKIADAEYDQCLRIWERDGKVSSPQCISILRSKGFYINGNDGKTGNW